jgi:hypothetical protein
MVAKKKSAKKAGKTAGKKASKKASKKAPAKKSGAKKAAQKPAAATISSLSVNMGHVFALRPRTNSSFRPGDFMTAKHQLQDESYASLPEAARAVAERALELTHDSGSRVGTRYDRR